MSDTEQRIFQLQTFTIPELQAMVQAATRQRDAIAAELTSNPSNSNLNAQFLQATNNLQQTQSDLAGAQTELAGLLATLPPTPNAPSAPLPTQPNAIPRPPNSTPLQPSNAPNTVPRNNAPSPNAPFPNSGTPATGNVSNDQPSTAEQISDFFTQEAAGLPVWAWFLIGAALLALIIGLIAWGASAASAARRAQDQLEQTRRAIALSGRDPLLERQRYDAFR